MKEEQKNQEQEFPEENFVEEDLLIEIFAKDKKINTSNFSCGVESLDNYAKTLLSQDVKRGLAVCYVFQTDGQLSGFYTLSSAQIDASDYLKIKKGVGSRLPIPVILIGRFAIDGAQQGKGCGGILLLDAIRRAIETSKAVASKAIIVDPINEAASSFYEKFGFMKIPDTNKMMLTMEEGAMLIG